MHAQRPSRHHFGSIIICASLLAAAWTVDTAGQSGSRFWPISRGPFVTLTWDASGDPSVVGYIVYVGTDSRRYTRAFDIGNRTSFVYPYAALNRRYFFAVASYSSGRFAGELSAEVSGFGRLVPARGYTLDVTLTPLGGDGPFSQCVEGVSCLEAATVSAAAGRISALASSAEGEVWFVEDKHRIFMIDLDGTVRRIERRPIGNGRWVEGLVIDPRFRTTRHVYVQEIDRHGDGSRELTISRYREVTGTLRDRAVIVHGVRFPASGSAPFTVDEAGRIFVAIPRDRRGSRHEGVVFAVQSDGTYVRGPSGSPTSWPGLSNPSSLTWDPEGQELWLSGADTAGSARVERLPVPSPPDVARRTPGDARRYLLLLASGGWLLRVDRHAARAEPVMLGGANKVTAIAGGGRDVVFAVADSDAASGSRIVAIPMAD